MPTTKSAGKRVKTSEKANARNRMVKSSVKTAMKKLLSLKTKENAKELLTSASKIIDKAAQKGVYHKNNAARKKANLAAFVNKLSK